MQASKVLELLNNNDLEELRKQAEKEIMSKSLPSDAKSRMSAHSKYFTIAPQGVKNNYNLQKPYYDSGTGNYVLCDGISVVVTKEKVNLPLFDGEEWLNYKEMFSGYSDNTSYKADIERALQEMSLKGYKLVKKNLEDNKYFLKVKDKYIKCALLHKCFSILNDGKYPTVYLVKGNKSPMYIETSIGVACILPVHLGDEEKDETFVEVKLA